MNFLHRFLQCGALLFSCATLSLSVFAADEYLVIDVSSGFGGSYPVSYYDQNSLPGSATDERYKTDKILLKKVVAGTFMMGSPTNEVGRPPSNPNEDLHQVTLTEDYYLGVYETTEYQWGQLFGESNPMKSPVYGEAYTVNIILQFIDPLNLQAELGELEVTIPTEAQWEYACRAGTSSSYSFGDDTNQLANYAWYDANQSLQPGGFVNEVGTRQPNPWGFYDMHGSVKEYCSDAYTINLGNSAVTDPVHPTGTGSHVVKGGGFNSSAGDCRSAARQSMDASGQETGFRICVTLPSPTPTYELTVVNGSGDGSYTNGHIQQIIADAPPAWHQFDQWAGSTNVADVYAATTTVTIASANIALTATYKQLRYAVTVSNGTASASTATNAQVIAITANPPATETNVFYRWTGDVATVANINAMTTTVTIAGADVALTATYRDAPYLLTVTGGTGTGYHFKGEVVTITAPPPDATHTFWWSGYAVADPEAWNTTLTMPGSDLAVSATYPDVKYNLIVVNGNGGGSYTNGAKVSVSPKAPPSNLHEFDVWAGDTGGLASLSDESTVFTVTGADALIEPHYKPLAAVAGEYMVVDLQYSGNRFDVTYMDSPPAGGWMDDHKNGKMALRRIMPGSYTMGSGSIPYEDAHTVTLTESFYIGVFEVTQGQWNKVVGGYPSAYTGANRDYHPVENISYEDIRGADKGVNWPSGSDVDASSFVGVMRTKTSSDGFDIPTEAQWEYACRAGTQTPFSCDESEISSYAWFSVNSGGTSQKVGTKLPNPWGLYDVHGNVFELCSDWFHGSGLGTAPQTDPVGPSEPSTVTSTWHKRVRRGGAFTLPTAYAKSGYRAGLQDSHTATNTGFRVIMAAGIPHTLTIVNSKVDNSGTFRYRAKIAISANEPQPGQIFDYWKLEPQGAFAGPLFNPERRDTVISMPRQNITVSAQYK